LIAAPVQAEGPTGAESARPECAFDREAALALDLVTFDQTEGSGWRPLHDAHCYIEAAGLLRDWQERHHGDFDATNPRDRFIVEFLRWHEGQMWANAGRNDLALPLLESTHKKGENPRDLAWDVYVEGTLAFLRRNRLGLEAAITELAAIPKPPGWDNSVGADGKPISMRWPQNLDVLQGLSRCWEQPYAVAYVCRDVQKLR
jgi:hypothetical protein